MALLWMDGFEQYSNSADLRDVYHASLLSTSLQTGRNTAGGNNKSLEMDFASDFVLKHLPQESSSTVVIGFAYQGRTALQTSDICRLYNGGTEMITLRYLSGELFVDRGSTNIAVTSGISLVNTIWFYFELKIFIHDSTGTVELWIDGVKEIDDTGLDTRNGTPTTIDRIYLQGNNSDPNFDDLYFLDDSGSDATDRLGDSRVETIFPNADGNTNDFTAVGSGTTNADRVDDGGTPDDDTTYVHSATATEKDLYEYETLQGSIDTVFGVQVTLYARKEETGERTIRTIARSNVTEVEGVDLTLGVEYRYMSHIYENDPNGGINWTEAAVNAAEFGIKIQA